MADAFQPRFVDLVRNYTDTTGTGDLVLGSAAPGFTSFTQALNPGDRFYYSVMGLDRTDESEVGRGTLQADGTIAREAISGTLTNFSAGSKTVALVTAAEWFAQVASQNAPSTVATRAGLATLGTDSPALLTEPGREGLFLFDPADLSMRVGADIAQGLYVAPQTDPTGASGAWVRTFDGAVRASWFGWTEGDAGGANCAANDAAVQAMFAAVEACAFNLAVELHRGLYNIDLGPGAYEISAPIEIKSGALIIAGRGGGHGSATQAAGATRIICRGCTGFLIQASDTSGTTTVDAVDHFGAGLPVLRDFGLDGDYSGAEGSFHGVHARASFIAENINVRNFSGDGWHVDSDTVKTGGNANGFLMIRCDAWTCTNGFYATGNNANAGTLMGCAFLRNRQWGVWDDTLIGNYFYGIRTNYNGLTDGTSAPSVVHRNGHWYSVVVGQEAGASTNGPTANTSDNSWWYYLTDGAADSSHPEWATGSVYRAGGAIRTSKAASKSCFVGGYIEQNQGKAQINQGSLVLGGMISEWCSQSPAATEGTSILSSGIDGCVQVEPFLQSTGGSVTVQLGAPRGNSSNIALKSSHPTDSPNGHSFLFSSGNYLLTYGASSAASNIMGMFTGPNTAAMFGSGSSQPYSTFVPRLYLGDANDTSARRVMLAAAAPTSGSFGIGSLCFNRSSDPNLFAHKCVVDGSPGTWRDLYGLSSMSAIASGLKTGASDRLLGRSTSGAGSVEEIPCTAAARALLDDPDPAAQRTTLGLKRGLAFHCAGIPNAAEVIGGGIAPYAMVLSAVNSSCKALAAATTAVSIPIKNNGAQIGSIAFSAGATTGSVSFTAASVAVGDQVTLHNATIADATLADIDGLLCE